MRKSNLRPRRQHKKSAEVRAKLSQQALITTSSFFVSSSAHVGRVGYERPHAAYSTQWANFTLVMKMPLCLCWKCWPWPLWIPPNLPVDCCPVFIIVYVWSVYVQNVVCKTECEEQDGSYTKCLKIFCRRCQVLQQPRIKAFCRAILKGCSTF